jgi:hypothetical protein
MTRDHTSCSRNLPESGIKTAAEITMDRAMSAADATCRSQRKMPEARLKPRRLLLAAAEATPPQSVIASV